jgi:ABC-2 type transport system permease protein
MATTTAIEPQAATRQGQPERTNLTLYARAFAGLLLRDLYVLRRELFPFAVRVAMNPLLFLFVFTYVFPHMSGGAASNPMARGAAAGVSFSTVLLPGLMAVAIMFSGIAAVALPLASEFGITREIDDRVMCPLPVPFVAFEKIFFSAMQSVVAACIVYPLAIYIPSTPAQAHITSWPFLILVLLLASLVSGALGLTIGTSVKPQQIGLIFGVVVVPITFLGCVYYPWAALKSLPVLQHAILINPIVYMSEGLRSALTPSLGHMNNVAIIGMLLFFLCLLSFIGMRGFLRRVIN